MGKRCPSNLELSAWLDGELPAGRRRRIEDHVERCPFCAAEVASLGRVRSLVSRLDEIAPVPLDVRPERIWRKVRLELTQERARVHWQRSWVRTQGMRASVWWGASSLAGALVVSLFVVAGRGFSNWSYPWSRSADLPQEPSPAVMTTGAESVPEQVVNQGRLMLTGAGTASRSDSGLDLSADRMAVAGTTTGKQESGQTSPSTDGRTGRSGTLVLADWSASEDTSQARAMFSPYSYPWLGGARAVQGAAADGMAPASASQGGASSASMKESDRGFATPGQVRDTQVRDAYGGQGGSASGGQVQPAQLHPASVGVADMGSHVSEAQVGAPAVTPQVTSASMQVVPATVARAGNGGQPMREADGTARGTAGLETAITSFEDSPSRKENPSPSRAGKKIAEPLPAAQPTWQMLKEDHQAYAQQQGTPSADQVEQAVVQLAVLAAPPDGSGGGSANTAH
ncbi:MAG: zf-HC2 domain-containing protein [Limnochordaceae bacterium]|nr:zf-HC2 domain-containing protein [Limnochordaceae bacterium]